jgi:hypothetical protein
MKRGMHRLSSHEFSLSSQMGSKLPELAEHLGVRYLVKLAVIAQEIFVQRLLIDVHVSLAFDGR